MGRRLRGTGLRGLAILLLCASPAIAAGEGEPAVAYSTAPDHIVVRYIEVVGELEESDPGPTLTIFGDGRAVAHYPAYMRRAGDHVATLTRGELDGLVASLAAKGVAGFDAAAVQQQVGAAEAARAAALSTGDVPATVLVAVTDPSTTVIELSIDAYDAGDEGVALGQTATRAVWRGLAADVAQHPSVEALNDLDAARTELRQVMEQVYGGAP